MKQNDPTWNYFDITEDGSQKIARCKDCLTVVSCKVERLKAHKQKCHSVVEILASEASSTSDKLHVESPINTPVKRKANELGGKSTLYTFFNCCIQLAHSHPCLWISVCYCLSVWHLV